MDAAVIGAGVMGCAAARSLAKRGLSVALLERESPGHAGGSSHGDGRIFRFTYAEPIYVRLAEEAERHWRDLEATSGERLLERCGNWDCGPEGSSEIEALVANLESQGRPWELLSADEAQDRFPDLSPPAGGVVLFQAEGGVLRAGRALAALLAAAQADGAELVPNAGVEHVAAGDDGFELALEDDRRIATRRLVIAAGGWSGPLLARLGLRLPLIVTREQVAYFRTKEDRDHGPEALPTVIDYHDGHIFYGLPALSDLGVKLGWHHGGAILREPGGDGEIDRANLAEVRAFARRRLPGLDPEPVHVEHCLYTSTPDHHFLVDRHPTLPGLAFGAGFSGHGFKFAPVIGDALAALALEEDFPLPMDGLGLDRLG